MVDYVPYRSFCMLDSRLHIVMKPFVCWLQRGHTLAAESFLFCPLFFCYAFFVLQE